MKYFERVTMEGFNQRAKKDKRKKVNFLICSYLNEQGHEYRKKFEFDRSMTYTEMFRNIPAQID